jgi:DNA-binding MarR family transcriptional regulator
MTEHVEKALYEALWQMAENLPLFQKLSFGDSMPKDLTFTEMHTMTLIGRLGEPRMSELAARGHVTQGTMTGMINKLVKKGYVKRTRGTKDRRVVKVSLTARGRRVDRIHEQHHLALIDKIAHALTKSEQRQMVKMIQKIAAVLE